MLDSFAGKGTTWLWRMSVNMLLIMLKWKSCRTQWRKGECFWLLMCYEFIRTFQLHLSQNGRDVWNMKVDNFLGVFAKLQKVTITFVMSVHPSIHPHGTTFLWNFWYLSIFWKSAKKIQVPLKSNKNNRYFIWRPMHICNISLNFFRMRNIAVKSCRENQNTRFVFSNVFPKIVLFMR